MTTGTCSENALAISHRLSQRRQLAQDQAISFLMQQGVENPGVISLAAGLVDQQMLPVEATRMAFESLFADRERAQDALQYGTTPGIQRLRTEVIRHLARLEGTTVDELCLDPNRVLLTTGSQQLLALVADVLLDPGDICLVAAPTYFVFLGTLAGVGARALPVAADRDGMCMDALEQQLQRLTATGELDRVKLIYLGSYYENPSGVSLGAERRARAVEIAKRWSECHQIFVLEDAAYRELRYDGPELASVWSFDSERNTVILTQTFSKSFSPGLRVGFAVVPEPLVKPICDLKGNEDFGSACLNQHLMATVFEQGLYEPHVRKLCASYCAKRDAMIGAADKYFGDIDRVDWYRPNGGLYVWMSLPDTVDTGFSGPLFRRATEHEGVMYVPGDLCFSAEQTPLPRNNLRLSFGVQSIEGIEEGMRRLARAVRAIIH